MRAPIPFPRLLSFATAFLACYAALLFTPAAHAALPHPALSIAPIPAWVETPLDPLLPVERPDAAESGLDYHVNERQESVAHQAAFAHYAFRITDAASLTDAAEFAFTFDPGYETVAVHHLRVIRDGVAEDRLDPDAFEILRLERDRDRAIYDGRLTAIHQMRDVRIGDIVHFAYTRTGANPVFAGHYSRNLSLAWSTPARQFRVRIIHPVSRPLHWRLRGENAPAPTTRKLPGDLAELRWELAPLPATNAEADTPDWHVDYPFAQISEHATWADVAAWALPLYPTDSDHPDLLAKIAELRAASADPEQRILAALRFVQEDIRYLAVALGVNSHQPSPPADTLARRFGDCKDKTLLLCTLLRGLGIQADPALVDTYSGRALRDAQPSPIVFDHVIARVVLPGGRTVWLDPTRLYQTGPLDQRLSSDFGYSLSLRPDTDGLEPMTRLALAPDRLHETVTITSHAFDRPADMEITSLYTGERATSMRAYLADTTPARITQSYLNYYLQQFPGLTSTESVSWNDDRDTNQIRVTERYLLPDFWSQPDADGVITAELYPHALNQLTASPANQDRRAPLSIAHPSETLVHLVVNLHSDWSIEKFDADLSDKHQHYVSTVRYADRVLTATYHLRNKLDHVPAAEVADYARTLAKIRDDLTITLTHTPPSADALADEPDFRLNPWALAVAVATLLASIGISWRVLARRTARGTPPPLPPSEAPPTIGGWLLLAALGVVLRPINLWRQIPPALPDFFNAQTWMPLITGDDETRNLPLAVLILFEVAANSALYVFVLLAAILFFMRRREAPLWNILVIGGGLLFLLIDNFAVYLIADVGMEPEEWGQLIGMTAAAAVWIPYFLVSERAKATFVK